MLVICCLTRVINGKIIEDEVIYNFWRFLVEDFFLPVINPPGTYFNDKLLPSCRSSKFSSSFPATSILLCAPLDPNRPDRNSKSAWRQSILIFLRQTLHWKLRRAATFLVISFPAWFLQQQLEQIYAGFYVTWHASLQLSRKIPWMDDSIWTLFVVPLL